MFGDKLNFDLGKSLKVGTIPIIVMVVIGIFGAVVGRIPVLSLLLCIVGIPLTLVSWAVNAWAGYKAVKEAGMDLVGGAITGAIVGAIAGLINAIIGFVLSILGIGVGMATGGTSGLGAAVGVGFGIFAIVLAPILGAIIGAILGAIGAFVAGMKK